MVAAEIATQGGSSDSGNAQQKQKARSALQALTQKNEDVWRSATAVVAEISDVATLQCRTSASIAAGQRHTFSPQVLTMLKRNADQLFELKQQRIAEKQGAKENSKKMMLWMSGASAEPVDVSGTATGPTTGSDAVKQRKFNPLQLGGSSIAGGGQAAAGPKWQALKFWQVGTHNRSTGSRPLTDTPGLIDQQPPPQKGLSALLFGRSRRQSTDAAASPNRRVSIDPAASWRSSVDSSFNGRRVSNRSSDSGAMRASLSNSIVPAGAAAASDEGGGVWSSLAAGEGPLSKSHSLLATKPGTQQELMVGKSLECVAEDEREGRDSPVPAEPSRQQAALGTQQMSLPPIRVPRSSMSMKANSPVESFSFGCRPDEEQVHSPSFLRGSISSRVAQANGGVAAVAGPLVRSSVALRVSMANRMDPFEAPEPEPAQFVEQLKAENQEAAAAAPGLVAALRRSISGAGKGGSRRTSRQSMEGSVAMAAAAAAPGPMQASPGPRPLPMSLQQQQQAMQPQQQQQMHQQPSESELPFLDLDATRAYAMGVHQVMMGLQQSMRSAHSLSDTSSKPTTPRGASLPGDEGDTVAPAPLLTVQQQQTGGQPDSPVQAEQVEGQQQLQQQSSIQRVSTRDSSPRGDGASGAGTQPPDADASGMPPLRSGLTSPAASRRQAHLGGSSSVARQLPMMGQASMEILEKPAQQLQGSRQQPLSTSTTLTLADVYKQTSGSLTPLSAGLSGIARRSSSNVPKALVGQQASLPPRGPAAAPSSILANSRNFPLEASQTGAAAGGGMGPLSMQYGSTMHQAKKSAQAAGLVAASPREQLKSLGWGWQGAGGQGMALGAVLADPTADPAAFAANNNNKYASSWGLLDAGSLSRQSSAGGGSLSRLPSGGMLPYPNAPGGSQRASPRQSMSSDQQQPAPAVAGWQQQQRGGGAAGRYAGALMTPTGSQSPRSGAVTPRRESESVLAAVASSSRPGSARQQSAAGMAHGSSQQMQQGTAARSNTMQVVHGTSRAGSDDSGNYASADEQLSSGPSGLSGISGPYASSGGGQQAAAAAATAPPGGNAAAAGAAGLPMPPAFLSTRPTSAQAAVAAQWSPNKNVAAYAQAPVYTRDPGLTVSTETSGVNYGMLPNGLPGGTPFSAAAGPWDHASSSNASAPPAAAAAHAFRMSGTGSGGRLSGLLSAPASSYNIYAPLDPPAAKPPQVARPAQQQQGIVTAVDLARRQSQVRRASSTGAQQASDFGAYSSSNGRGVYSGNGYGSSSSSSYGVAAAGSFGRIGSLPASHAAVRQQQWQQQPQYRY